MKIFSLRVLLVLCLLVGSWTASSGWVEAAVEKSLTNINVEQWTGHSFTFLELPSSEQAAGYEIFTVNNSTRGFDGDRSARLSYADHVGKQVDITGVEAFGAGGSQHEYMVYMTVSDTGEKLVGSTMRGQLEGLVLTADLNNARQQFLGKTIYPKYRALSRLSAPGSDITPATVTVPIGSPVTVIDVYAGYRSQEPIQLIVSMGDEKMVLPVAYSWTNIPTQSWMQTAPWQEALFTEDPRTTLGGSSDVWSQIEKGNVKEGMTKEQVHLSWGKPNRIKENGSVWTYSTTQLKFNGDVLESIETISE